MGIPTLNDVYCFCFVLFFDELVDFAEHFALDEWLERLDPTGETLGKLWERGKNIG